MASVQVLPLANYQNGSHPAGPVDIADDVVSIDFSIQRKTTATPTIWPNATTLLTITPQVSLDGGSTWIECGPTTASGDIGYDKNHNEAPFTVGGGAIPSGTNRKYKVTATISGGPLRSSATIEVN
jgi:hypothetical protein